MKLCPFCAEEIQEAAIVCKHCGRDLVARAENPAAKDRGRLLGFIGAGLLAIGVFTPIARMPIVGSVNYFRNGTGDGTIVLLCAAIAAFAAARRRYDWLLPSGVSSASLLTIVWIQFSNRIASMHASMSNDLKDNPFRGLAEAMTQSVQLEWGWAVMFAGAGALIVGAVIDRRGVSWHC